MPATKCSATITFGVNRLTFTVPLGSANYYNDFTQPRP
jgi:hypothetical protein